MSLFDVQQGSIEGGNISPDSFKVDVNDMLLEVKNKHLGTNIGTIYCAAPTCAEDIAVVSLTLQSEPNPIALHHRRSLQ